MQFKLTETFETFMAILANHPGPTTCNDVLQLLRFTNGPRHSWREIPENPVIDMTFEKKMDGSDTSLKVKVAGNSGKSKGECQHNFNQAGLFKGFLTTIDIEPFYFFDLLGPSFLGGWHPAQTTMIGGTFTFLCLGIP